MKIRSFESLIGLFISMFGFLTKKLSSIHENFIMLNQIEVHDGKEHIEWSIIPMCS